MSILVAHTIKHIVHTNPYASYIIIAFIIGAAALYCVPTLFRLLRKADPTLIPPTADAAEDKGFANHDEAFHHHPNTTQK